MDLAEFLLARIAEDEEWCSLVLEMAEEQRANASPATTTFAAVIGQQIAADPRIGDWLLKAADGWQPPNTPARVLAECEAKRRIVELHQLVRVDLTGDCCMTCLSGDEGSAYIPGPCDTLLLLALPYADHPDYREEWAPTVAV